MNAYDIIGKLLDTPVKKTAMLLGSLILLMITLYLCVPRVMDAVRGPEKQNPPSQQNNGDHNQGAGVNNGNMNQTNQ